MSQRNQLFGVRHPYNVIENIHSIKDGFFEASVQVQNHIHGEQTLISAAEAGRHLSILGAYILSKQNEQPGQRYYLTQRVDLKRGRSQGVFKKGTLHPVHLRLKGKAFFLDNRQKTGFAETSILTIKNELLFEMNFRFKSVSHETFHRKFSGKFNHALRPANHNPYIKSPLIQVTSMDEDMLTGRLIKTNETDWTGHFDDYASIPLDIIGAALTKLAGMHLKLYLKNNLLPMAVKESNLTSFQPAFSNDPVTLHCSLIKSSKASYTFLTKANGQNENLLAIMEITFELTLNIHSTKKELTHYFPIRIPPRPSDDFSPN